MLEWSLFADFDCIRNVALLLTACYVSLRLCCFVWTQVNLVLIYARKPSFDFAGAADGGFGKSVFLITGKINEIISSSSLFY